MLPFFPLAILLLLTKCAKQSPRSVPPICGDYRLVEKTAGQRVVHDTVYHAFPAFVLLNQDGEQIRAADTNGKVRLVSFFTIHGSSQQQLQQAQMHRLYAQWADRVDILFLSFTVWPEYDSVERLAAYSREQHLDKRRWQLLTGNRETLYEVGRDLLMLNAPLGNADDFPAGVLILLDAQGKVRGSYQANDQASLRELATDVDLLSRATDT